MANFTFTLDLRNVENGSPLIGAALVELKVSAIGYTFYEVGNGIYKRDSIPQGRYALWINGLNTNQSFAVGSGEVAGLGYMDGKVIGSGVDGLGYVDPNIGLESHISDPEAHKELFDAVIQNIETDLSDKVSKTDENVQSTVSGLNIQNASIGNYTLSPTAARFGHKKFADNAGFGVIQSENGSLAIKSPINRTVEIGNLNNPVAISVDATGIPRLSQTPAPASNDNQIATTAFVKTDLSDKVSKTETAPQTIVSELRINNHVFSYYDEVQNISSATNSARTVRKDYAISTGDMSNGFGTRTTTSIRDFAGAESQIVAHDSLRDGADNSGIYRLKIANNGFLNDRLVVDKVGTVNATGKLQEAGVDISTKYGPTNMTVSDEPAQDVLPSGLMAVATAVQWLRNNVKQLFTAMTGKLDRVVEATRLVIAHDSTIRLLVSAQTYDFTISGLTGPFPAYDTNNNTFITANWTRRLFFPSYFGSNITSNTTITPAPLELRKVSNMMTVTLTNAPIPGTISYLGIVVGCASAGFFISYSGVDNVAYKYKVIHTGTGTGDYLLKIVRLIKTDLGWMIEE